MVKVQQEDGGTIVRLGRKDWVKFGILLMGCLWGHAQLQCTRINAIDTNVTELKVRVRATEKSVTDIRNDCRDLNAFIRNRAKAEATPAAH